MGGLRESETAVSAVQVGLPDLIDMLGHIDLLKLDVEGAEYDALAACSHDQLSRVDRIVMETHGPSLCPWVGYRRQGSLIERLLDTHAIEMFGKPDGVGMLYADLQDPVVYERESFPR